MVEEPSHVKQVSLNHMCKIGLTSFGNNKETLTDSYHSKIFVSRKMAL
jgi:hypothetical protein